MAAPIEEAATAMAAPSRAGQLELLAGWAGWAAAADWTAWAGTGSGPVAWAGPPPRASTRSARAPAASTALPARRARPTRRRGRRSAQNVPAGAAAATGRQTSQTERAPHPRGRWGKARAGTAAPGPGTPG